MPVDFTVPETPVRSLSEAEVHVRALTGRVQELERRVRRMEDMYDTYDTPAWKRLLFVLDGWPLWRIVERPQRRPWRRWWTS